MAVTSPAGVIGCVWGAWQRLRQAMGPDCAPSYDWCEREYRSVRQGQLPPVGDKGLPDALTMHLEQAWLDHGQPELFP